MNHIGKLAAFTVVFATLGCAKPSSNEFETFIEKVRSSNLRSAQIPQTTKGFTQRMVTSKGFVISFDRPVQVGRYILPPNPFYVAYGTRPVSIVSVTHPDLRDEEISVSIPPKTYGAIPGQPYDPNVSDYNPALRLSFPYTFTPESGFAIHITTLDAQRKDQHVYPYLSIEHNEFVRFQKEVPRFDEIMPPLIGDEQAANSKYYIIEMLQNWHHFTPAHLPLPPMKSLAEVLPQVCGRVHMLSGFSNISGGQKYVSGPIGDPQSNGAYQSTYGAFRMREMGNYLLPMMNPNEPAHLRQLGMACFLQNVAGGYLGMALSNFATNESGGHGGGILVSSFLNTLFFPSQTELLPRLQSAVQNGRYSESTQIYRSPVDNNVYYGSSPWNPNAFSRCAVGSFFHWAHGNWTYCVMRLGDPNLQAFDAGIGSGYQEIGAGMFVGTIYMMLQFEKLREHINHELVMEYMQRYLSQGIRSYNPNVESALEESFLNAISEHNSAAGSNGWSQIPSSVAQDKIQELISRQGYYSMSHTHNDIYQWVLNHLNISR